MEDWLSLEGSEVSDEDFQIALKKKSFGGQKGEMMLELQKSIGVDKRFTLDKRFKDDIKVEKVSEKVKALTDAFDKEDEAMEEYDPTEVKREVERYKGVMAKLLDNQDLLQHKRIRTPHKELVVKRFNPNKVQPKPKESEKPTKKEEKAVEVKKLKAGVKKLLNEEENKPRKIEISRNMNYFKMFSMGTDKNEAEMKEEVEKEEKPKPSPKKDEEALKIKLKLEKEKKRQEKARLREEKKERKHQWAKRQRKIDRKAFEAYRKEHGDEKATEYERMVKKIREAKKR